jgi:hypothetical protein
MHLKKKQCDRTLKNQILFLHLMIRGTAPL